MVRVRKWTEQIQFNVEVQKAHCLPTFVQRKHATKSNVHENLIEGSNAVIGWKIIACDSLIGYIQGTI